MENLSNLILTGVVGGFFAIFGFLAKHAFNALQEDLKELKKSTSIYAMNIAKIEGKIEILLCSLEKNSAQMALSSKQLEKLWSTVEGQARVSDLLSRGK